MLPTIFYAIISGAIISLVSFAGLVLLFLKKGLQQKLLLSLVGLSAGILTGAAFFHILPEVIGRLDAIRLFVYVSFGIITFFVLERFLFWHHCHDEHGDCEVHSFTYMSLVGGGFHVLIDGIVIGTAFSVNTQLGFVTLFVIVSHQFPQELGDFATLVHGGFSKGKAFFYNFLSSLTGIIGAIIGVLFAAKIGSFTNVLLPFAAGGFLYIAMSDLIPQLHNERNISKSIFNILLFVAGLSFMLLIKIFFE